MARDPRLFKRFFASGFLDKGSLNIREREYEWGVHIAIFAGYADMDDDLWHELTGHFSEEAIIELVMIAGFYRTVSYLTNGLRIPGEDFAARFPV